ncbi:MAG: Hpt domain-containing protein [Gammaproteobacteria bacterium]|nr:Hpt domain-containing protein [Gammaproteobacteria bacterium]
MSLQQSYIALDWVKDALEETLQKVKSNLLEQTPFSLQLACDGLHQVSGTLHIAQLTETLVLSEVLEKILQAVVDGKLKFSNVEADINKALDLLLEELDHLQRTKSSRPAAIYAQVELLNGLLLNEPTPNKKLSFTPDFSLLDKEFLAQNRTVPQYEKLTQAYQYLLAIWLGGNASPQTLADFTRVASLLKLSAQSRIESVIWDVATVFHQAVSNGSLSDSEKIRPLLIKLERALVIVDQTESESNLALLGDLLFALDPQQISNPEVSQLRQLYGLDLPELGEASNRLLDSALQQVLAARDGLVIDRNTAAISLREATRLLEASGWHPLAKDTEAKLHQLVAEYKPEPQIVDRFAVDLNQLADKIKQTIEMTSQSDKPTGGGIIQDARHAAVRESRTALEKIKAALANYHQSRRDVATLAAVPELLKMVGGAFTMLSLPRAADLLKHTVSALKSTILKEKYIPHWKQTDLLAQLISSIEYYLDQLAGQYQDDNILALAEETLKEFKKPHGGAEPIPAGGEKLYHDETSATVIDHIEAPTEVSTEATSHAVAEELPVVASVVDVENVTASEAELSDNPYNDDFEQDDEIREIFIEETEEVLESIATYYPKWKADFKDEASLKETRRAFHTLKGSGRMVGARTVGELAWSIESLFNRLLDHSVQPNHSMTQLVDSVYGAMPILIKSYEEKRPNTPEMRQKIATWMSNADALIHSRPVIADGAPEVAVESVSANEAVVAVAKDDASQKKNQASGSQALPLHLLSDQAPKALPLDDFGQDAEIREIFLEEAGDVLAELNEHFPQWAVKFENEAALKVIRRNFHTLKGSGRMVGAHASAELAWSIERLLNSVLEHSITATQSIVQLVGEVVAIIPGLVEDFSAGRAPSINLLPIIHTAWLLQAGHDINATQIQNVIQKADEGYSDIPVLDDEQFLLEDFDALTEVLNSQNSELESVPEPEPTKVAAVAAPAPAKAKKEVSIDELDPQLLEIFVSEAEGYLEDIRAFVKENLIAGKHEVLTTDVLLRALHTLRGSAGMTGIESIYQLAHVMEHECKRLMREHVAMTDAHIDALVDLDRLTTSQVNLLKEGKMPVLDEVSYEFIDRVEGLMPKKGEAVADEPEPVFTGLVTELMDIGIDDVLDAEWTLKERLSESDALAHVAALNTQMLKLSDAVVHVPIAPLTSLVSALQHAYQHVLAYPALLTAHHDTLVDDLLSGHAALTRMFDALAASIQVKAEDSVIQRLQQLLQQTSSESKLSAQQDVVEPVAAVQEVKTVAEAPKTAASFEYPVDSDNDPELLEVFMEEAEELVQEIDQSFTAWAEETENKEPIKALQRHMHTLKGGARMARVESLGDYTHELETVYERLVENNEKTPEVLVRFLRHAQDQVAQQVDQLAQSQKSFFTPTETSTLQQYIKSRDIQVLQSYFDLMDSNRNAGATSSKVETPVAPTPVVEQAVVAPKVEVVEPAKPTPQPAPIVDAAPELPVVGQMQVLAEAWDEGSAPDPDVLEIFLDEAGEIIDLTSTQLAKWLKGSSQASDPSHKKLLQDLQRNLHTFKGGARMAGIDSLGDLSHEMEFVYEDLALGKKEVSPAIGQLLNQSHDWLADAIAVLDRGERPQMPTALIDALKLFRKDPALLIAATQVKPAVVHETDTAKTVEAAKTATKTVAAPQAETIITHSDESGLPPTTGLFPKKHESEVSSTEMVRVSATLMEKMINLAGENAISRARIEMELTGFAYTVDEMGVAIQKIAEQLRRMDGELESQIIARHQDEVSQHDGGQYQDFDPLEMDQYSSINQLSKSLAESVSDLLDFRNTLIEKSRDSESLLLQQSRIQSELQEGLMSSRLVPFSRLVPRLQRVVRQTATELGKPVELVIQNAEGELDRSVLERMVAPLEHMLRNAVDHGMEPPADRAAQQKPEKGTITLSVMREGSEVIITLQDDGRGINVDAVRRKAIERGIIDDATVQTDHDIMQFIFHAGLSTAAAVTQISGRGVGMDVVQSEIRQLGGVVTVDSTAGKGTCFTLRLPLTVAVTDALRVRVGDRIFAVSLSQIERIVRVNTIELEKFYQSNQQTYKVDGQDYRLRYLGELIGGAHTPTLYGQNIPSPLLLIKYEGQRFAVQVDQLIGSREEMVIKPVGAQLAGVGSISGATILGDGSVVIILDLVALARSAGSVARTSAPQETELKAAAAGVQKQTIMVVDDSVTVRKVTTRLLERHGYQVIAAKDGVDAMSKLEDAHPDLMLLDIEMPRMDGFEVATLVRHSPRLSYLPIIMITSRTGEKHRERAYSIGVNGYMGKPFQEQILLENISDLLLESQAEIARNKNLA